MINLVMVFAALPQEHSSRKVKGAWRISLGGFHLIRSVVLPLPVLEEGVRD